MVCLAVKAYMAGIAVSNILLQIVNYNLVPSLLPLCIVSLPLGVSVFWLGFVYGCQYLQSHPVPPQMGHTPYPSASIHVQHNPVDRVVQMFRLQVAVDLCYCNVAMS